MSFSFRSRWFWAFAVLLSLDLAAGAVLLIRTFSREATKFRRVGPQELSSTDERIQITFSRPMVGPQETLIVRSLPGLKVTPAAEVLGLWRSTTVLELRPRPRFAAATQYEITLPGNLLDMEGHPLQDRQSLRVQTPRLQIEEAWQASLSRDWALTLGLRFNDEVPLSELDRAIHFSDVFVSAGQQAHMHGT